MKLNIGELLKEHEFEQFGESASHQVKEKYKQYRLWQDPLS